MSFLLDGTSYQKGVPQFLINRFLICETLLYCLCYSHRLALKPIIRKNDTKFSKVSFYKKPVSIKSCKNNHSSRNMGLLYLL